MTVFGESYAGAYDDLYAGKDYRGECDRIELLFRRHAAGEIASVLDLGCGTGTHALLLAQRGYRLTGVDLAPDMLLQARAKADSDGIAASWIEGDVRTVDAGGPYDAALMMFAVLGYQHTNDDAVATFANARRHLRPGGLLVFDTWYGPGVIADPPTSGSRAAETIGGTILRNVTSELDVRHHLCHVQYTLSRTDEDGVTRMSRETHVVRYFFPMEIELLLGATGFELMAMSAFEDPDRDPDGRTWNVLVVAKAKA